MGIPGAALRVLASIPMRLRPENAVMERFSAARERAAALAPRELPPMTSTADAKAVVRAYVEAFNAGDFERLQSLFAPDAQIWGVLGWGGLDVAMPVWRELHHGLSMTLTVEALVAEGDTVAARYVERGRFVGPFRGFPGREPNGASYELAAMEFFEVRHGRIQRRWGARDSASQARQLDLA
jgi:predicted ester cyclase